MSSYLDELFTEICGGESIFSYHGEITPDRINLILEEVEERLTAAEVNSKAKKKIYNILVESLQNLYHHSEEIPKELVDQIGSRYGMVFLKQENDRFRLIVGNFVSKEKVNFLTEKLEKINSLSVDELKEMYMFILNYQKLSAKGGGGLGLVDIARKSNEKLEYKFYPYNENYSFYRLDIFVSVI